MGLYCVGDTHGDFSKIFNFANKMKLNSNDGIIILGDCGLLWNHNRKDERKIIDFFEKTYNFMLYFIDGNQRR